VKRLLLTCDQVFEVLTRGPFPTGDESDEHVEHHLQACHDCRQLAEALRPAVELLHEVIAEEHALALPEYQGSLPDDGPRACRLSVVRLAKAPSAEQTVFPQRRSERSISNLRLVAAGLLIAGLSLWFAGLSAERNNRGLTALSSWLTTPATSEFRQTDGLPDGAALLSLASLNLPATCLPLTHRPVSNEQAAEIALALADGSLDKLRCCTECHHAGQPKAAQRRSPTLAAVAMQNCQGCHRG
jgi:hypothetical protein